ncbi:MAG: alpha/beta hydrolase [Clostridiales bacterium]|jgi:acetyl esterase/lipase|nr:alpha/beta hydrolase [Clostridiales bacterium]
MQIFITVLVTIGAEIVLFGGVALLFWVRMPRNYAKKNRAAWTNVKQFPPGLEKECGEKIERINDLIYPSLYPNNTFDLYLPKERKEGQKFPVLLWVHGGGWFAGDKGGSANLLKFAALNGYCGIGMNYVLAPEKRYPAQLKQIRDILAHIPALSAQYPADASRIVIGGDSAGGNLTAQYLAVATNKTLAAKIKIGKAFYAESVKAAVLLSAPLDWNTLLPRGNFQATLMRIIWTNIYFGFRPDKKKQKNLCATQDYITSSFPATFLTTGNQAGLEGHFEAQNKRFGAALRQSGVSVEELYFDPAEHKDVPHVYLHDLSDAAALEAINKVVAFMNKTVKREPV